jgi:lactoylglutathione lyase/methylmalonyl-CoA/ethylmalonyl-CoA epimerase
MPVQISHIGIAVKDLEKSVRTYTEALGLRHEETVESPETGMAAAMLAIGNASLELLAPIGTEGVIAKFIENKGEGIHHLAVEVDDIVKTLESLTAQGVQLIDKVPRDGIEGKVAFVHPKSMNGVLIELVEKPKE